jgi:hypothetical protein
VARYRPMPPSPRLNESLPRTDCCRKFDAITVTRSCELFQAHAYISRHTRMDTAEITRVATLASPPTIQPPWTAHKVAPSTSLCRHRFWPPPARIPCPQTEYTGAAIPRTE